MGFTGIIIILVQVISKIAGFAREIILSNFYGASDITDAFLTASTLPSTIYAIIGAAITVSFIPLYNRAKQKKGIEAAEEFASILINIILIITILMSVIIFVFATPLVRIFALGFKDETLVLAVKLTRISILSIVFLGLTGVITPYLNIKKQFIIPSMIGIPLNIGIIGGIVVSTNRSPLLLGLGILVGYAMQTFILLPSLMKGKYSYNPVIKLRNPYVKQMLALAIPIIIGTSANQLNFLIDRTIASTLEVGAISALNYAVRLNTFAQGLIILPIITLLYPTISELAVNKDNEKLNETIYKTISVITLLITPIIVGGFILSKEITSVLFMRGAFDEKALIMTEGAVQYYILGTAGLAFRELFSRVFYSFNDTITPVKNTIIAVLINVILNIILSRLMGIKGLAFATSISATIAAGLLKRDLKKYLIVDGSSKKVFKNILKIIVSGILMGLAILLYRIIVNPEINIIQLILQVGLGAVIFISMIIVFQVSEINESLKMINNLKFLERIKKAINQKQ